MTDTLTVALLTAYLGISLSCTTDPTAYDDPDPNILWILLEDTAPLLGAYGTTIIATPNIDELAEAGVRYTNVFMPAPVCSPSRSSIITGTMSTTLGLHNHHSSRTDESAIYLPDGTKPSPSSSMKQGTFPSTMARTTTTSTTTVAIFMIKVTRNTHSMENVVTGSSSLI